MELLPNSELITWSIEAVLSGVAVVALTNAIKDWLPVNFHKVLPYLVGIVLALVAFGLAWANILIGILLGLVATGEYRLVKPVK